MLRNLYVISKEDTYWNDPGGEWVYDVEQASKFKNNKEALDIIKRNQLNAGQVVFVMKL